MDYKLATRKCGAKPWYYILKKDLQTLKYTEVSIELCNPLFLDRSFSHLNRFNLADFSNCTVCEMAEENLYLILLECFENERFKN